MRTLLSYFLQGLLYILPITITAYTLYWLFNQLDTLFAFRYPGLGILIVVVFVTVIGFLGSYFIQLPLFRYLNKLLEQAPGIKLIYTSVRDMLQAFVGQKRSFNQPVLVRLYENSAVCRLGFVTDEGKASLSDGTTLVSVYVPHSFTVSGQLFLVPPSYVSPLNQKPADIMKYIVAGGVAQLEGDAK